MEIIKTSLEVNENDADAFHVFRVLPLGFIGVFFLPGPANGCSRPFICTRFSVPSSAPLPGCRDLFAGRCLF